MNRNDGVDRREREADVLVDRHWKRIPAGITLPWIIKAANRLGNADIHIARRRVSQAGKVVEMRIVEKDSVRRAHDRQAVALRIERKPQARREMQPARGAFRVARVGNA